MLTHIRCAACGWFGLVKRRRDRRAADAALVAFHAGLAAETRAARSRRLYAVTAVQREDLTRRYALGRAG